MTSPRRIAVVNRGEAAMRLIRAVRELNADGGVPRRIVALHTSEEADASFVRAADEGVDLGPVAARPYLDLAALENAMSAHRVDEAWVGWGFVAEVPAFVELCERMGVTFVGPSPDAMRSLGDKIEAKLLAEKAGVPVAPWSGGGLSSVEDAIAAAGELGYPLMLKASAGGGGRGIRRITGPEDLVEGFDRARQEAERSFGDGTVFLERQVAAARHVEVQIIADGQGVAWALGVRDCSIQRRNQKIIEESASPVLRRDQVDELKTAAENLALLVGYRGAGTVEFLYNPQDEQFSFLEVNTRLQVEHSVTELTTGCDLVKAQLHIATGGRLEGARPRERGHAIEVRINAEDPDREFAPAPGRIDRAHFAAGPGIRIDTGVREGDTILPDFDSMIAKVVAYGGDRAEALARLRRALVETSVVVAGGNTNKAFALELLDEPAVLSGTADTAWVDREYLAHRRPRPHVGVALIAAGIQAYERLVASERRHFLTTARGGRPQVSHAMGRSVQFDVLGTTVDVRVVQSDSTRYEVTIADGTSSRTVGVEFVRLDRHTARLTLGAAVHELVLALHGSTQTIEVDGTVVHRIGAAEAGVLHAPAPALIVATPVAPGSHVQPGDPVIVLESMKMETVVRAPVAAQIIEVKVAVGGQVQGGDPLVRLEPTTSAERTGQVERPREQIALGLPEQTDDRDAEVVLSRLRSMILGFDVDDVGLETLAPASARRYELRAVELEILGIFAGMLDLGRGHRRRDDRTQVHAPSARDQFHLYLQSLDVDRAGVTEGFKKILLAALAGYDVTQLDRTPELERGVFHLYMAQQRVESATGLVSGLLRSWMAEPPPPPEVTRTAVEVLTRLGAAAHGRFPDLSDLAHSLAYRWFEEPERHTERVGLLEAVAAELEVLTREPSPADADERVQRLAQTPVRTVELMSERLRKRQFHGWEPMLEVLIRRHYQEHVGPVGSTVLGGRHFVVGEFPVDGAPRRLLSAIGAVGELAGNTPLSRGLAQLLADGDVPVVIDLYLLWSGSAMHPEEVASRLARDLQVWLPLTNVERVTLGVTGADGGDLGYYTFRRTEACFAEDRQIRGLHPRMADRLQLWRLRDFDLTRLPAPDDVLLYHCVARSQPADQRLVALAQVRRLTVVRDEHGTIVSVPETERTVRACVEAIRRVRLARGPDEPLLDTNHVWVYLWPVVDGLPGNLDGLRHLVPQVFSNGIKEVLLEGRMRLPDGEVIEDAVRLVDDPAMGPTATYEARPQSALEPVTDYDRKVAGSLRRGYVYPYELVTTLTKGDGEFVEYDLVGADLVRVDRAAAANSAGVVVGVVTTRTAVHPEGIRRVCLLGDPTKSLGAVGEAECSRICAALDLAERERIPVEWFALSSGARISLDSGTENMDWVARALKRIVEFTQNGGEINVVVAGINVGAQPYWNAEATMLMHTKGVLIMTPASAMVLTGKQSLDFSGGVSAEDNFGIGGYDRVMGPNGQAQYWAPDLRAACALLLVHYDRTVVLDEGAVLPRRAATTDPSDRDISPFPHSLVGSEFRTVGDIFSSTLNAQRKKPFNIRDVMRAVADQDCDFSERWSQMHDADTAVVVSASIGGWPVTLAGIESTNIPRRGYPPADGPETYSAGTLFPQSSKKLARAINSASGRHPVVILANLSGFDGSPESMRNLQLEFGAEIGRSVVNFRGPIIFSVISRYHGGAFVVFSKALNPGMTVLALEGSFASVIGGGPAAAVVLTREVDRRAAAHHELQRLRAELRSTADPERAGDVAARYAQRAADVRQELTRELAAEFDAVHTIQRAVTVGSVDDLIGPADLRPRIITAIDRWAREHRRPLADEQSPAGSPTLSSSTDNIVG